MALILTNNLRQVSFSALKDFVARFGSRCQPEISAESCQVRGAGAADGGVGPPGVQADEVEGGGGENVREPGLGQAPVAGGTDPSGADGLGDGALYSGADVMALLPGVGLLFGSLPVQGLLRWPRQQGQTPSVAMPLRACALFACRARAAVAGVDLDQVLETLYAPFFQRWLHRSGPLTAEYAGSLVDITLRAFRP